MGSVGLTIRGKVAKLYPESVQYLRVCLLVGKMTREMIQANREATFLYGDNWMETGSGGQAKEARGEWNAIGVPTKKKPSMLPDAFLSDNEFRKNKTKIDAALALIPSNGVLVIPKAGLGTGLARLEHYAPLTNTYLRAAVKQYVLGSFFVPDYTFEEILCIQKF